MKLLVPVLALLLWGSMLPVSAADNDANRSGFNAAKAPPDAQVEIPNGTPEQVCAATAASPIEPGFEKSGLSLAKMNRRAAFFSCMAAVQQNPGNSAASRFRLARADILINNMDKAMADFTASAEAGYLPAMEQLASLYSDGEYYPVDFGKPFGRLQRVVAADDKAGYRLGEFYERGVGVPKNWSLAMALLAAGGQRQFEAANALGQAYECGCRFAAAASAIHYYRIAARGGVVESAAALAAALSDKPVHSTTPLGRSPGISMLPRRDRLYAQVELGDAYADRERFVTMNFRLAAFYYGQAAASGSTEAVAGLGRLYFYGDAGVPQDRSKAAAVFRPGCRGRQPRSTR